MPKTTGKMIPWVYDIILWTLGILVDLFFREVHPRGSWRIPRRGPVIFVAAPHANQFVDSLVLMRILRMEAHRRISNIIAAKSMGRRFIGTMAGWMGSIPVGRAMDLVKPGKGKIYMPDPVKEPLLVKGVGTDFEHEAQKGGLLVLPTVDGVTASTEIEEIVGPEELKLKKEFKSTSYVEQLTGKGNSGDPEQGFEGSKYKLAPKVDQTQVYDAVFNRLQRGGAICIFPEGGSHDRTELLPLKAGVAIMALGSLAANPKSGLRIVCCGMNYFHAHKFRSRAVVEFGVPIDVSPELVEMYRSGERREATRQLLEIIYNGLLSVTVTCPDYDILMLIQAVRRLYRPKGKKLPLPMIVELNRRLTKGYERYKDDPRLVELKKEVLAYNKQLWQLGVRDHQVEYAKFSLPVVVFTFIYRLGKITLLSIGTLPGLILFAPVFIVSKVISIKKSREALAASTVKLQGRDVIATWKLLVSMAFAPLLYTFYSALLTYWTYRNRIQGYMPNWVALWMVPVVGYVVFPAITFAALRIGEVGMDILKSLRPLALSLNPSSSNTFVRLRARREQLSIDVTDLINELGPEMFPDFEHTRLVAAPAKTNAVDESDLPRSPPAHSRNSSDLQDPASPRRGGPARGLTAHEQLPRNESFHDLGNLGIFSTRPPSRSHSHSRSNSNSHGNEGLKGLSPISDKETLEKVSQKIRGAMRERGVQRRRRRSEASWEFASSGTVTPSDDGRKEA